MTFSMKNLSRNLADHLAPFFPDTAFFEDPNQQGSSMPCMFLQQRFASIERRIGKRFFRKIGLDLTYLVDYNLPDLQQQYLQAADILDGCMNSFFYFEGEEAVPILTYERSWTIDLDALHYKFEIHVWTEQESEETPMQSVEYEVEVTQ